MAPVKRRKPAPTRAPRSARPIRVLVADDHRLFLQALKALLGQHGFLVVAQATDGREAVELAQRVRPDVVILDRLMPGLNGLDAAALIARRVPGIAMVLLTGLVEEGVLQQAQRRGIRGFVAKTQVVQDLVQAIHDVRRGGLYVSPAFCRVTAAEHSLSPREREVLRLIGEGKSLKEVAAQLGTSPKTVAAHRANLKKKLQVRETASLVCYARRANARSA